MAIGTARSYLKLRSLPPALLLIHLALKAIHPAATPFIDLYLYNAIALLAAVSAYLSPSFNDRLARVSLSSALTLWAIGSSATTWNSFYSATIWPNLSDLCYLFFYPLILFGLIRALTSHRNFRSSELLDVVIITGGFSTLIAALFLKNAMSHFVGSSTSVYLSIVYPIGDVVLLAVACIIVAVQRKVLRSLFILGGISIFTATDFYFLYKSATTGYGFAQITDDGWLLGLLLISEALWHYGGEEEIGPTLISTLTTIATIFSGVVLAISALRRGFFEPVVLLPAIATIALAVGRMAMALGEAKSAVNNLELERLDELTGLANRRRFISEMNGMASGSGSLLLLDLDGFKAVNDTLGHEAGDELLRQISLRFSRVVPNSAMLARLGGDEFGVLVPGNPRTGEEVAQALCSTVSYPFTIAGHEINIGVSIGRVINDGSPELMSRADSAMYQAKRAGGGTVLWEP
jgi:diguanylate cyclase (GGDEF)-like protein